MRRFTTDLIRILAREHHRSQAHYARAIKEVFTGIADQLAQGHHVQLTGIGTFYTRKQPAAHITSIRSGTPVTVRSHRVAAFRVGTMLKQAAKAGK